LWVLARGAARELAWGLPAVSREVHRWRTRARAIPDRPLREDALSALQRKRGQTDGAALFSILPAARSLPLLRLLVAYQIMWDFLDSVHERAAEPRNGVQLHTALVDALDPTRAPRDYYMHHPWKHDGGYLSELVRVCRENCLRLPGFQAVAPLIATEAARAEVLALNHEPDPRARDALLKAWARREFAGVTDVSWWELSGAASAGLTIFALLALAADDNTPAQLLSRTRAVYSPWTTAAATMLDSYVDRVEDEANGDHSYVAHYPTQERAVERIGQLIQRAICSTRQLPNAEGHTLIAACMVAMYLTKDAARAPATKHLTVRIARSGGSLTRGLMPILRLWRIAYAQRGT
jgi:tetraprenyl-beta-curcumene synthase